MKLYHCCPAALPMCLTPSVSAAAAVSDRPALPTAEQCARAGAEIGVLIHYDMPTCHPGCNWRKFGSQPQAVAFQGPPEHGNAVRRIGNERGVAFPETWAVCNAVTRSDGVAEVGDGQRGGTPDGSLRCPGEADFPLRRNSSFPGGRFRKKGQDNALFPSAR